MKEAQTLARQASANLTMNVYARARDGRLAGVAQAVGDNVWSKGNTTGTQQKAGSYVSTRSEKRYMVPGAGLEPAHPITGTRSLA